MSSGISRRSILKGVAAAAGAAAGSRLVGPWLGTAEAATEPTSVFVLHFIGGYNSIFASAKELQGSFGVAAGNYTVLGNGLSVDDLYADSMSPFVKSHMAAVGVSGLASFHDGAQRQLWTPNKNMGYQLANAMGGKAAIKAALVGGAIDPELAGPAVGGTTWQKILDMQKVIDALGGGGAPGSRVPERSVALAQLQAAQKMSASTTAASPVSLESVDTGYATAISGLQQSVQTFDYDELKLAYGLTASTAVNSFTAQMAAAELMIRAGTNLVLAVNAGWDSHGDVTGVNVRNKMSKTILPSLNKFLNRMVADPKRNVVAVILGDFARSLPKSDHQPNVSATVIGKYVKQGTTGRVNAKVSLPAGTPGPAGLWSYVATVAKSPSNPFGKNPHTALVV